MTDPLREAREAGRQRPGIAYPLPRATRPDTQLAIDAALPEAAALNRGERPPTWWTFQNQDAWREIACQNPRSNADRARTGAIPASGHGIAPPECTSPRSAHHTKDTGVNRLPLV